MFIFFPKCLLPAFAEVGGYNALLEKYRSAIPSQFTSMDLQRYNISSECYTPRQDAFSLLRDASSGDLPWPGVVFGIAIVGVWYWCSDQVNAVMTLVLLNHTQIRNYTSIPRLVLFFCR